MTRFRLDRTPSTGTRETLAQDLKAALRALAAGTLPLAAGRSQGGAIDDRDTTFSLLRLEESGNLTVARVGVFFTEVVGGCNCSEDPVEHNAYCVLEVRIDRTTGIAEIVPSGE